MKSSIIVNIIFAALAATTTVQASTVQASTDITYKGRDELAGWNIAYSITTYGALGLLTLADIVTDTITFTGSATSNPANVTVAGKNTFYFSNTLADGSSGTSPVSATAKNLLFDFSGAGGMSFCQDGFATCLAYTPAFATDADSLVYHPNVQLPIKEVDGPNNNYQLQPGTYVSVAATKQAFATVPEPATLAMMIAGFGMVGGTLRSRTRNSVAA